MSRDLVLWLSLIGQLAYGCELLKDQEAELSAEPQQLNRVEKDKVEEPSPYPLSKWRPFKSSLPQTSHLPPISDRTINQWRLWVRAFADHLESADDDNTEEMKTLVLTRRHLFCDSDHEGSYLQRLGDLNPEIRLQPTQKSSDHISLFLFDVDAVIDRGHELLEPQIDTQMKWSDRGGHLLWAIIELDRNTQRIPEGFGGQGLKIGGKSKLSSWGGARQLANDYTQRFSSPTLSGIYYGYDGPCRLWNDPLAQHRVLAFAISSEATSRELFASLDNLSDQQVSHPRSLLAWRWFSKYIDQVNTQQLPLNQELGALAKSHKVSISYAIWQTPLPSFDIWNSIEH